MCTSHTSLHDIKYLSKSFINSLVTRKFRHQCTDSMVSDCYSEITLG